MISIRWFDDSLRSYCGAIVQTRDEGNSLYCALKASPRISEIVARHVENGTRLLPERGFQEEGEDAAMQRVAQRMAAERVARAAAADDDRCACERPGCSAEATGISYTPPLCFGCLKDWQKARGESITWEAFIVTPAAAPASGGP